MKQAKYALIALTLISLKTFANSLDLGYDNSSAKKNNLYPLYLELREELPSPSFPRLLNLSIRNSGQAIVAVNNVSFKEVAPSGLETLCFSSPGFTLQPNEAKKLASLDRNQCLDLPLSMANSNWSGLIEDGSVPVIVLGQTSLAARRIIYTVNYSYSADSNLVREHKTADWTLLFAHEGD